MNIKVHIILRILNILHQCLKLNLSIRLMLVDALYYLLVTSDDFIHVFILRFINLIKMNGLDH